MREELTEAARGRITPDCGPRGAGEHSRIKEEELGSVVREDLLGRIRALHELAVKKGYVTCITTGNASEPFSEISQNFRW